MESVYLRGWGAFHVVGLLLLIATTSLEACSLLISTDDLGTGGMKTGASDATSDGVGPAVDGGPDALPDAGDSIFGCNADGLVAYWAMSEGSGFTVSDCRFAINGVFSGSGTTWGMRDASSCLEFDGNAFVFFPDASKLQLPGAFTVAGWLRSDATAVRWASLYGNFSANGGFEIALSPKGELYAQLNLGAPGKVMAFYPDLPPNTWAHLAAVYEPGIRLEIYVDGASVNKVTALDGGALPMVPTPQSDRDPRLAALNPDTVWKGAVDDVRVFSRALSDAEIAELAKH